METRKCKISARKAGGKASKNAKKYSLGLPSKWVHQMGMSAERRDLIISFDGSVITVRKNETPDVSHEDPAVSGEQEQRNADALNAQEKQPESVELNFN